MPLMGQNDVMFMPWMTAYLSIDNLNIYSTLHNEFGDVVLKEPAVWAPYPYGYYALTAAWIHFTQLFSGIDLSTWYWAWGVTDPARHVFYFKLLYLPFDCLILYTLYTKIGALAGQLWAWSPVAIYTPFMMGQNDVYATALTVVAVWSLNRYHVAQVKDIQLSKPFQWAVAAAILLGFGAAFKIYPLILLIPLLLTVTLTWKQRILLAAVSGTIFVASAVPFLTTRAYIEGVLFNPEGSQLLRQVTILGVELPMFLISYSILVAGLLYYTKIQSTESSPWFVALIVLALLFLWVPAPLYWLYWITPILIATVAYCRQMWIAWLFLQASFALSIPMQHRELGIALPIHLEPSFNLPNLPVSLLITNAPLTAYILPVQKAVDVLFICSLLMSIAFAFWWLWKPAFETQRDAGITHKNQLLVSLIPLLLLTVLLGLNLYAGRNYVSQNLWLDWENTIVTAEEPFVQELMRPSEASISGLRLKVEDMSSQAIISFCLYNDGLVQKSEVACGTSQANKLVEDRQLYIPLQEQVSVDKEALLSLKLSVDSLDSAENIDQQAVILTGRDESLGKMVIDGQTQYGSANLSLLTEFQPRQVARRWLINNVLRDTQLLFSMSLVFLFVIAFMFSLSPAVYSAE